MGVSIMLNCSNWQSKQRETSQLLLLHHRATLEQEQVESRTKYGHFRLLSDLLWESAGLNGRELLVIEVCKHTAQYGVMLKQTVQICVKDSGKHSYCGSSINILHPGCRNTFTVKCGVWQGHSQSSNKTEQQSASFKVSLLIQSQFACANMSSVLYVYLTIFVHILQRKDFYPCALADTGTHTEEAESSHIIQKQLLHSKHKTLQQGVCSPLFQ